MLARVLLTSAVLTLSSVTAQALTPAVDTVTAKANDLRGLTFAADGKIYVSGYRGDTDTATVTVVGRFNADGTPDASFGEGGFVEVDLGSGRVEQSLAVAELSGGDVVALVNAADEGGGTSVYLLRFDANGVQKMGAAWGGQNGAVEVVFGWANADNGSFTGENPPQDTAWDLKVANAGNGEKLVVNGYGPAVKGSGRTDNDRYIAQLLAGDGSPDPTFNGGVPFTYHSTKTFSDGGRRAIVEEDGSILSAGYTNFGEGIRHHVILIRLRPDGTPDASFGNFVAPSSTIEAIGLTPSPGVAIFNPFRVDGGFAECYAVAKLSDGSYVTTGYGGVTAEGTPSSLGFKTTQAQDIVAMRVTGSGLSESWGNNGQQAVQSEGAGLPTAEDRGRMIVGLADDRTVHVGRYGGIPAVAVLDPTGQFDTGVGQGGVLSLPNDTIDSQFYGAALSADGSRIALTTNSNEAGARLVVLDVPM